MKKRKFTPFNILCLITLWLMLCYFVIKGNDALDGKTIFAIVASGIIVFVPIYKSFRKKDE